MKRTLRGYISLYTYYIRHTENKRELILHHPGGNEGGEEERVGLGRHGGIDGLMNDAIYSIFNSI